MQYIHVTSHILIYCGRVCDRIISDMSATRVKQLSRAELEREFIALQAQLAEWEQKGEVKVAPSKPRDRKKHTAAVVMKRGRREEVKMAVAERVRAAIARAPIEERKWETPEWITQTRLVRLRDIRLTIPNGYPGSADPLTITREFEDATVERLINLIGELGSIKVMMRMSCRMIKDTFKQEVTQDTVYEDKFDPTTNSIYKNTTMKELLNADPVAIRAFVREKSQKLIEEFESFVQNGSGWAVESVEYLYMAIDQYRPGRGGSNTR